MTPRQRCLPLAITLAVLLTPTAARAATAPPPDLPAGVPAAGTNPPATLPEPSSSEWPFPADAFPRTSGTGREEGGATYWSDFLYDDHGAAIPSALPASVPTLTTSYLAPTNGVYAYPSGPADGDGADIFRSAIGASATDTWWRVDWNTLADPAVPIAEWAIDTDANPATGVSAWPASAQVSSPGIDEALVVSSRGAQLINTTTSQKTPLPVIVDAQARSFIVKVPTTLLSLTGTSTVRLAAGLADATGTAFAEPDLSASGTAALGLATLLTLPRVYNVTYRSVAQEPPVVTDSLTASLEAAFSSTLSSIPGLSTVGLDGLGRFITGNFWSEDAQADALFSHDVSAFQQTVDWAGLRAHQSTPEPQPTGASVRWYVSSLDLGQGVVPNAASNPTGDLRPNYLGRVQPYSVYVPTGLTGKAPLTWILHSLGVNHLQYEALDPTFIQELCQDRHSICASTLGFGPDGWYYDEAETDFWQVWRALADTYDLDVDRTTIAGYSMGGWATYKLGLAHPDLFAEALTLEGPPTCGVLVLRQSDGTETRQPAGAGGCTTDGSNATWIGNARWLPYVITVGAADELVPVTGDLQTTPLMTSHQERWTQWLLPAEDHLVYATQDRFAPQVADLGGTPQRATNPGHITYTWSPALTKPSLGIGATTAWWASDLQARTSDPGSTATVDGLAAGIPDPAVTTTQTGPTPVTTPFVATRSSLVWTTGARPAAKDALTLTLTDVKHLSVDAQRIRLACGTVTVTSDGPATLELTHLPSGTRTITLTKATQTTQLTCTAAQAKAQNTLLHKHNPTVTAPKGSLAATGSGALAPALAGLLVAAAALLRRRRAVLG